MIFHGYHELNEAVAILNRILDALLGFAPVKTGHGGSDLRRLVGDLRAKARPLIADQTVGTSLMSCFDEAVNVGVTLGDMDVIREAILAEAPDFAFGTSVRACGVAFCVIAQSRIIAAMSFRSRTDVQAMLTRMAAVFDEVKLDVAEHMDSATYQTITALCAAVVNHLATTELRLPELITFTASANLPALMLANLIYGDAARSDELIEENKIVNPAFCPLSIRVMSQ